MRSKMNHRTIAVMLGILLALGTASALRNPAAVYCQTLGYDYEIHDTDQGQVGYCHLPHQTVPAWDFLNGRTGLEYSYCAQQGYEAKWVTQSDVCTDCTVCVVNGQDIEVTELMDLSFEETSCGDGSCGLPETPESCPQDCKEEVAPTPPETEEVVQPAPETGDTLTIIIIILVMIVIILIAVTIVKFKK